MPSTLFNVLFVAALIVPAAMYILGVLVLMTSLVLGHRTAEAEPVGSVEAIAH